eukprot:TRINITY_DN112_c0_g1_i4.p1 TRINITY_DN112_c0_g1~~TRINITY_DN112_c0_g1_i4.p1  ORF type:complete len:1137 (+),score=186.62 TRINITY_DN112_c0_g1_i4:2715-6125(+)
MMMRVGLLFVVLVLVVSSSFVVHAKPSNNRKRAAKTDAEWDAAIARARTFANGLSVTDLANMCTGISPSQNGGRYGRCSGTTWPLSNGFQGQCWMDGSLGVQGVNVTAFPTAMNAAQTWDRDLIYERARMMGFEFRKCGVNGVFGPIVNMHRIPHGGRNWETFGADPHLMGEAGVLTVQGIQDNGVIAGIKHFVGNEQETNRRYSNSIIDQRTLYEVYMYPFQKTVKAGVGAMMGAYNLINNTYACMSDDLNNRILRQQWGFRGFVMTDWNAIAPIPFTGTTQQQRLAGITMAANGGMDMSLPGDIWTKGDLASAINGGSVSVAQARLMVTRIMTPYYLFGQDSGYPSTNLNTAVPGVSTDHYVLARKMAADSAVLLKNVNNILPLKLTQRLAVIGRDAGPPPAGLAAQQRANPAHNVADSTLIMGWGSGTVRITYQVEPLVAITAKWPAGSVRSMLDDWNIAGAVNAATNSDVALVFVQANSGEGYLQIDGNTGDRKNISLWHGADNLINAVANVKQTIVIIHAPSQVTMTPWIDNPNVVGVIWAGFPGQETGNGLVDVLTGATNPSGKLVYTIARNPADYPAMLSAPAASYANIQQIPYSEGMLVDYRWFDYYDKTPLFEFGFGLSYTTFAYSLMSISGSAQPGTGDDDTTVLFNVRVTITNTGSVDGAEVVQLYIGFPPEANMQPIRLLKGFEKITLAAGVSSVVTLPLSQFDLSWWDVSTQKWTLSAGMYKAWVGTSSRLLRMSDTFWVGPVATTTTAHAASTQAVYATTLSAATFSANGLSTLNAANAQASTSTQSAATSTQSAASTAAFAAATSSASNANSLSTSNSAVASTQAAAATTQSVAASTQQAAYVSTSNVATSAASAITTTTTGSAKKNDLLYSKVGLAWPDGDFSNMWALAGNGWNQVSWIHTLGPWNIPSAVVAQLDFVPTLASCSSVNDWENAKAAGHFDNSSAVMSFYKPDLNSDMSPDTSVMLWRKHIEPLHGEGYNLGAPLVSNTPRGRQWLTDFFQKCTGCNFDFIPVEYFGDSCGELQSVVSTIHSTFNKPIWVTEYACAPTTTGPGCSPDTVPDFLFCSITWLHSTSYVERFSYYGASTIGVPSYNALLSADGSTNTLLGVQYVRNDDPRDRQK